MRIFKLAISTMTGLRQIVSECHREAQRLTDTKVRRILFLNK